MLTNSYRYADVYCVECGGLRKILPGNRDFHFNGCSLGLPIAPVRYAHIQRGFGSVPEAIMWHALENIPRLTATPRLEETPVGICEELFIPKDSTVSTQTLRKYGYNVPDWREADCGECGGTMGNHLGDCNL